jgi:Glycogen recognition site of AMP-activated protein kinase
MSLRPSRWVSCAYVDEFGLPATDFKLDSGVPALEIEEVKLEQSTVAFAEFKPTQAWNEAVAEVTETKQTVEHEESKQTLIEDGDESVEEQGVRVVWTKPAKSVTVTGTFDNWSQSQVCKETGSGFETFIPLTGSRNLVFKFVVDGVWTVSDEYETATDEHVFNVDVRETLIT